LTVRCAGGGSPLEARDRSKSSFVVDGGAQVGRAVDRAGLGDAAALHHAAAGVVDGEEDVVGDGLMGFVGVCGPVGPFGIEQGQMSPEAT
jgi:hypothetical protein